MRIALVINHFQPALGYQEYFLAHAWMRQGHQVTVVTSEYFFPFPHYDETVRAVLGDRRQPAGERVERGIPTIRLKTALMGPGGMVWALKGLKKTLIKMQPDIVFADGVFFPLTWQMAWIQRQMGFPLVYDSHASSFNTKLDDTLAKKLYLRVFKLGIPVIKKAVKGFTAVGTSEAQLVREVYGLKKDQVRVVLLGADTDQFKPNLRQRTNCRRKLGYSDQDIVFVHAGKLTAEKDVDILIEAFITLAQQQPHVKLLVIGQGPTEYVEALHRRVEVAQMQTAVTWLPSQPNDELAQFYNAADVGVWPGNLSNTIQEAMACGLPVVLSRRISAHQSTDHLVQGQSVIQVDRGKVSRFAQAMMQLATQQALRKQAGKDALTLIQQHYSWDVIAELLLKVYK